MADYVCGCFDIDLRFQYEDMLEKNSVNLSQYKYSDVHLPYDILTENHRNDEYVTGIYRRCLQEGKPWQEYIKPVKGKENVIY